MSVANGSAERHPVISEKRRKMATAALRKPEKSPAAVSSLKELGGCLDFARRYVGWTLDQLVAELQEQAGRTFDARQIARWIRGEERTQVDAVLCVRQLHGPFVIALANLRSEECVTEITIRLKGMAGYK
jgi:hypothetical protein